MNESDLRQLFLAHRSAPPTPPPDRIRGWVDGLLRLLFPELTGCCHDSYAEFERLWHDCRGTLLELLEGLGEASPGPAEELTERLFAAVPRLHELLLEDADAICAGDPAATDHAEVIRTYPGFLAIAIYRIAHEFHVLGVPVVPRVLTEHAHSRTGIDIHPGATIGERFCIDHGTGIVIGETTEIGRNVKLYQGVTLGALSVRKDLARVKRHPTVEDDVVIYAGTTILGGETVVGRGSVIGGNVWLLRSVPPGSRLHYAPGTVIEEPPAEGGGAERGG